MARGRRKALSLREQLDIVIADIAKAEESLKELKEQKKDLENQLKNQKLIELNELIEKSGMSIDEVKDMIEDKE